MKIVSNIKRPVGLMVNKVYTVFPFDPDVPEDVPTIEAEALLKTFPEIYSRHKEVEKPQPQEKIGRKRR